MYNCVGAYRKGGATAVKSKGRGRPKRFGLAGYEAATVVNLVGHRCPDQLKLPFVLWTRDAVRQLLADLWSALMRWNRLRTPLFCLTYRPRSHALWRRPITGGLGETYNSSD